MIPVTPQPEPASFDVLVRQPGVAWLAKQGIAGGPVAPGVDWKSYWTTVLPDLHAAYQGICAYSGCFIERVTGARTVEHFKPKKLYPALAFEWGNYRLVCSMLNGCKGEHEDVLDPFSLAAETFHLELASGRIYVNPTLTNAARIAAEATIRRLKLDSAECRNLRTGYFDDFIKNHIDGDYLFRRSPFVWYEAKRQGLL